MKIKNLFKPENWWILILASIIFWMMFTIFTNPEYNKAFYFILPGLRITFLSTVVSFLIAIFLGLVSGIGRISKNRIANIVNNNNCRFIPSFTNFVAIDCLKDSEFAKKVLENLINNGVFVRMPYSYPQNRCIRVTVGLDKDIDLFEKYFPIALKNAN